MFPGLARLPKSGSLFPSESTTRVPLGATPTGTTMVAVRRVWGPLWLGVKPAPRRPQSQNRRLRRRSSSSKRRKIIVSKTNESSWWRHVISRLWYAPSYHTRKISGGWVNQGWPFLTGGFRSDAKRESGRKRTTSGTRPLSSATDGLDPFDSLGIEKGPDGQVGAICWGDKHWLIFGLQEFSYGYLLVPTKPVKEFREKRLNTIDDPTETGHVTFNVAKRPHHVFAR